VVVEFALNEQMADGLIERLGEAGHGRLRWIGEE
jgi:hypothetical protein